MAGKAGIGTGPDAGWSRSFRRSAYEFSDLIHLQPSTAPSQPLSPEAGTFEELLKRDLQREKDGFPRKIRLGKIVKPGRGGKDNVILVPSVVEEKFIHDTRESPPQQTPESGGSGEGQEGEVIGEEPIHTAPGGGTGGAGQGEDDSHEIESSAYDLGRILTRSLELPNLKDKRKKRFLNRYGYELTDRHRGSGQFLDKKATLRRILETNLALNRVPDPSSIDPTELLVSPEDNVYRILSREKQLESQALVFFIRDYSGSMTGQPTDIIAAQHVLIYSWLTYQYESRVECRFVLHDTEAREVQDFQTYLTLSVAGGTRVEAAYKLVNESVTSGRLARDYNIYVFHGTDGQDWDSEGLGALAELRTMLGYSNRIGLTIATAEPVTAPPSAVEKFIADARLLEEFPDLIRLDTIHGEADETRLVQGIKALIS